VNHPSLDYLVVAVTPRLRIRRKHQSDALDDYAWKRDPEITRFDAAPPLSMSFSEFSVQFEKDLRGLDPLRRMYAVDTRAGVHIGNVMYYNLEQARGAAEFGISIANAGYREQGLGTEATVGFLRYLWSSTSLRLVYLHTLSWNDRALRCFERAGFSQVAQLTRKGHSFVRMETRREWWLMWDIEGRFDRWTATVGAPHGEASGVAVGAGAASPPED
jgi:RimJ/RimL family protein N-acetyltransferase